MNTAVLLLGSNLGNSEALLKEAVSLLKKTAGNLTKTSSIYKTAPWGFEHQNYFLNQVVIVETSLPPLLLLETILHIEKKLGRVREGSGYKERTIDIDILFYNDQKITENQLTIPHPYIQDRRFTLVPLNEILPGYIHPVLKKTITELLNECGDPLAVTPF